MIFPENKQFAFTILDDTDDSTVENVKPVYDLLDSLGMKTTKTVWASDCPEGSPAFSSGQTLQDEAYLKFVHGLNDRGFELAWHGATMESSKRARTEKALEFFNREFGYYPVLHCNHANNRENIYWGDKRYSNLLLQQVTRFIKRKKTRFCGEDENSPYFWGDLCKQHFRYVRNFTFPKLNILKIDSAMPCHVSKKPYVNYWFSTTDAPSVDQFSTCLTPNNIDRLVAEGGICIISTHLGKRFTANGNVDRRIVDSLEYLAKYNGWFVPVSDILDFMLAQHNNSRKDCSNQFGIELRHMVERMTNKMS